MISISWAHIVFLILYRSLTTSAHLSCLHEHQNNRHCHHHHHHHHYRHHHHKHPERNPAEAIHDHKVNEGEPSTKQHDNQSKEQFMKHILPLIKPISQEITQMTPKMTKSIKTKLINANKKLNIINLFKWPELNGKTMHQSPIMKLVNLHNKLVNHVHETRIHKGPIRIPNVTTSDYVKDPFTPPNELRNEHSLLCSDYKTSLNEMDKKFYLTTFKILTENSPENRRENGISFVQSTLFLYMQLLGLSTYADKNTANEIDEFTRFKCDNEVKLSVIKDIMNSLPISNNDLKFRWSSHLVLGPHQKTNDGAVTKAVVDALRLRIDRLNDTNEIVKTLNKLVEEDTHGIMRDTFEENDFLKEVESVMFTTLYFRCRWRAAPTLLNGTRPFYDAQSEDNHSLTPSMRINDIVGYTYLQELNAEAVEISYSIKGLSLIAVVPRGIPFRVLVGRLGDVGVSYVLERLQERRVAVTMPVYTLRMTLLLPNKLRAMGVTRLLSKWNENLNNGNQFLNSTAKYDDVDELHVSQAVQRIMFWAEAGQHAFKDDGIEWDETPDIKMSIDRPYVFFVRWKGLTILTGNFVL